MNSVIDGIIPKGHGASASNHVSTSKLDNAANGTFGHPVKGVNMRRALYKTTKLLITF